MILFKKIDALTAYLQQARSKGLKIGFAPTLGALHEGHISLIKASKSQNQLTVASIFVNPAQFNDPKDFEKYPVTLENDIALLLQAGCDILFLPSVQEIYPNGVGETPHYDLGYLETILEGKYRPGHFQGVCKVMERLLRIVEPNELFMGQKDYQQCMVVKRLIAIMSSQAQLYACPTLREADGLAMSSRNLRLNEADRKNATGISKALLYIKENIRSGNLSGIIGNSKLILDENKFRVDYVEIASAETLELMTEWDGVQKIVALVAAFQNDVRLIDNMLLN